MEDLNNMTAERSLEIITEQIERSRRAVSKTTGQSLYISGLCTMGMAVVVAIVNLLLANTEFMALGHLLWFALPVIIWLAMRNIHKRSEPVPTTLIGSLVGKTWWTFAVFVLGFFLMAFLWNKILALSVDDPTAYLAHRVNITPITLLARLGAPLTIVGQAQFLLPCLSVFLFAFVGLMLPGMKLKNS